MQNIGNRWLPSSTAPCPSPEHCTPLGPPFNIILRGYGLLESECTDQGGEQRGYYACVLSLDSRKEEPGPPEPRSCAVLT